MKYNIQNILGRYDSGESLEYLFFWGHHGKPDRVTKACLSQWYPASFEVDEVEYNCAEQYMMAEKARLFRDSETCEKIMSSSSPREIKALGRAVNNFNAELWSSVSKDIVVKGNLHKFSQNKDMFQFLCETGNKIIVEASPCDTIWGIGMSERDEGVSDPHNWKGTNHLGFALMEVRDMLVDSVAEDFDRAYIFISSMTSRQKTDMCACFLKLGCGIHEDVTSIKVVNLDNDSNFFANISFLVKYFNIKCYIRIGKEKNSERRKYSDNDVKQVLNLKTYKDYSRLSRQAISVIFDRVFSKKPVTAI